MYVLLTLEEKHPDCLKHAIHVTTLDASGASNVGWDTLVGGPFRSNEAFIAPICAPMIAQCATALGMDSVQIENEFIIIADEFLERFGNRKPAILAQDVWLKIKDDVQAQLNADTKTRKRKISTPPTLSS